MRPEVSRFVRSEAVLSREVNTGLLLLHAGGGPIVSLSGPGPVIWSLLRRPCSLGELVAELARQYQVEAASIARDVETTITCLVDADLLRRSAA